MDRISLTSSGSIPMNSPVLKMREIEFQLVAMQRENDELRVQLELKDQMIKQLMAEKENFLVEQEEAERRYMDLEDKFLEVEKMVKDRRGIISSTSSPYTSSMSVASSSSSQYPTTTIAASSSPSIAHTPLDASSQSIGRNPLGNSTNLARSSALPSPAINASQSMAPPNPLGSSSYSLASSTSVSPPTGSSSRGATNNNSKPPPSPALTSCVMGVNRDLEVSVVPSPTPNKKGGRKKSIISLFSL